MKLSIAMDATHLQLCSRHVPLKRSITLNYRRLVHGQLQLIAVSGSPCPQLGAPRPDSSRTRFFLVPERLQRAHQEKVVWRFDLKFSIGGDANLG